MEWDEEDGKVGRGEGVVREEGACREREHGGRRWSNGAIEGSW